MKGPALSARWEERMGDKIDDAALDPLFREARTFTKWEPRPVSDETIRNLYEILKWGPTSANGGPARFAFLRSRESKERLRPALAHSTSRRR
jgi:3-hydroxypropanoate dehydrogenase